MNHNTSGIEFNAMTHDELAGMMGGDGYFAERVGYGFGYMIGQVKNFWDFMTTGPIDLTTH